MAASRLDELPAELKELILRNSPSATCLHNLTRASPSFFRVYIRTKQGILSEVLCNILGEEGLLDAQATLFAEELADRGRGLGMINNFLYQWQYGWDCNYTTTGLPLDTSIRISRLLRSIDYLVDAFTAETLDCLKTLASHLQIRPSIPGTTEHGLQDELSASLVGAETARLHRAFLLLHTYTRLFFGNLRPEDRNYVYNPPYMAYREWRASFLNRFVAWEVEELASVYDFCRRVLTEKFDQLEDCFLEKSLASGRYESGRGNELKVTDGSVACHDEPENFISCDEASTECSEDDVLETPNCFRGRDWIFSHYASTDRNKLIESLICGGLPVISHILDSEVGPCLIRMISANADYHCPIMGLAPWMTQSRFSDIQCGREKTVLDGRFALALNIRPNEGLSWCSRHLGSAENPWPGLASLRRLGLSIWNETRLQASGIFQHT